MTKTNDLLNTMKAQKFQPQDPIVPGMFLPNKSGKALQQSFFNNDIVLLSGKKLYTDGGSDTYISEVTADELSFVTGGVTTVKSNAFGFACYVGGYHALSGDVSNPGFRFTADTDTGIYLPSAGQIGVAVSGGLQLDIDITRTYVRGQLYLSSANKLYLDGGSDTYIEEEAANIMHFVVGGGSVMRLDTSNSKVYNTFKFYKSNGATDNSQLNVKSISESLTITAGTGAAGVTTSASLAPAGSLIIGATVRVTTAPGGGATTFDLGVTGGDLDGLIDGISTAVDTTGNTFANGATDAVVPLRNISATTLTLTTNANVTGTSMVVRITVHYMDFTPPDG